MRVIDLDTRIEPFGDPVGDLPLLDCTLAEFRSREAGDDPNLTFADYAFATQPILEAFRAKAHGASRLALPTTSSSAQLAPVSSIERKDVLLYDIFLNAPDRELETLRRECTPVRIDLPRRTWRRELPRLGPLPHHIELPTDGVVAAHVEHWVHLLWLAPLLLPALMKTKPGKRRGTSFVMEGAEIHHRAYLEGAVIGPGTVVGADCSVRHSYVGAESVLADFTKITHSVFGAGTHTLADASFSHVVSLGDGTLANLLLRDTILGRSVFLTSGVIFWNEALERSVRVRHKGALEDTGRKNVGGCAGHGCVLGARTIVAPGRALPNRTTVVMRREEGVMRIEEGGGAPMCWHDGALVPVEQVQPGYTPEEVEP